MKYTFHTVITYLALLAISTTLNATEQLDNFHLGEQSFNQGEYQQAIKYFNNVLAEGKASPSLYYSLGSTYYKAKDYLNSKKYFFQLTSNINFSALAHYNLGLIAHKNNDGTTAIKHFNICRQTSKNKKLIQLSTKQINTLKKSNKSPFSGYLSAGLGHDSNITSDPDNLATNKSGSFAYASALANYVVSGSKSEGIVVKTSIYASDYFDSNTSDDNFLNLGLSFRNNPDTWKLYYDFNIKQSTYSHEDYQRTYLLTLTAAHKIHDNNELRLRLRFEDINSLSPRFDYLDGSRQKLRAEYRFNWKTDRLRFLYELELNNRQNTVTSNYSPTRHTIAARYKTRLNSHNTIRGEIAHRSSNYDATATQNRSDDRLSAALKHTYRFDNNWKLNTKIKHTTNDSNETGSDYDRTLITIDLSRNY